MSEQFLKGTSAHIRLFSAIHGMVVVRSREWQVGVTMT